MSTNQTTQSSSGLLDDYVPRNQVAAEIKIREETLIRWEKDGKGPPATRIGRGVFYYKPSFEKWLRSLEEAAA